MTADVSQDEISPLKALAFSNIQLISVTADVFQDEILPLKTDAPENMRIIVVTADVSQLDRSSRLNEIALRNIHFIRWQG